MIGRQNTGLTEEAVKALLKRYGIAQRDIEFEVDASTVHKVAAGPGPFVMDRSFINAFADCTVEAIDVSPYERAEIVHDLSQPIPDTLTRQFDFIYDGSSLDNIFDTTAAIKNYDRLLKPGGRMILMNWSNSLANAYSMLTPDWFMDFFSFNEYRDAKVYVVQMEPPHLSFWHYDPYVVQHGQTGYQISSITSKEMRATICVAEKGENDAKNASPVQQHYRGDDRDMYLASAKRFHESPRPIMQLQHWGKTTAKPNISNRNAVYLIADSNTGKY
ncbi:hypothetical protein Sa4125_15020 [Aureimonas sp. SA4125]|uniref:class I SAM-dependent methyltransferase n=1 Tax=Aureimonas sp. SA4125 TaxID=2826993 RepID=UPI001CC7D310|nr:class I SAM-dependent methyltransferase [Aureimonas sp. SA4125]BDA83960.1 hypothetical protein Sa4125_15020 [Aureimonas sp. SA4125]